MDLYEYQAKHLFGKHNVPVTAGEVCTTADAAREAARKAREAEREAAGECARRRPHSQYFFTLACHPSIWRWRSTAVLAARRCKSVRAPSAAVSARWPGSR